MHAVARHAGSHELIGRRNHDRVCLVVKQKPRSRGSLQGKCGRRKHLVPVAEEMETCGTIREIRKRCRRPGRSAPAGRRENHHRARLVNPDPARQPDAVLPVETDLPIGAKTILPALGGRVADRLTKFARRTPTEAPLTGLSYRPAGGVEFRLNAAAGLDVNRRSGRNLRQEHCEGKTQKWRSSHRMIPAL